MTGMMRSPSSRRVLYLTYDGLLEPLGGSQVVPYLTGLAGLGFDLDVLSWEKPEDLEGRERVAGLDERLRAAGIVWHRLRYHRRPTVAATALDMARGALRSLATGRAGPVLVHARSYVAAAVGLAVKEMTLCRLLFDMRGFWVDERIDAGIWSPDATVVAVARRVERALLREADAVVTLTRAGAASLPELAPRRPSSDVRVIPTCVDLERFRPADDPPALRRELGLSADGAVVVYAGSLSTWYLAEETVAIGREFAERSGGTFVLLTREVDLARRLVGGDAGRVVIRTVPHEEVPRWIAAGDAGLAPVRPSFSKRASAPTKIGEYLACGLAVAATSGVGDLEEEFRNSAVAFTFPAGEAAGSVAGRLLEAAREPGRVARARRLAEERYALEAGVRAYGELYRELGVVPAPPVTGAEPAPSSPGAREEGHP